MLFTSFLLDTTIVPGAGGTTAPAADAASGGNIFGSFVGNNSGMVILLYCVGLLAVMYFFSVRPNQKRERELAAQRNAIEVGDMVVTNAGLFGKVVDTTYDCLIVEFGTNKGVRIPVLRGEVFGKREPIWAKDAPEVPESQKPQKKGLFRRKTKTEDQ